MENRLPLVTVITPTYNQAHYLAQCIDSVLIQDYPVIEYIVLNDGSKDNTEEILKRYMGRIIWETQPNMGEYRTIHKGFGMSRGNYIVILSSDDYLFPGALSTLVSFMEENPGYIIGYPDYNIVDEDNQLIQYVRNYDYNFENAVRWFACMPGPAAILRREVYEKLGGRDTNFRYVGDFDFYLRAGLLGQFARVPATVAAYRWHSTSATQGRNKIVAEEHLRLARKFFSTPNLPKSILNLKKESLSSAYYLAGIVCSTNPSDLRKRYYFLRAFLSSPRIHLGEYSYRLQLILQSLVGNMIQKKICNWVENRKTKILATG